MRVLLLNPPSNEKYVKESRCQHKAAVLQSVYPPLTLATIAALLRDAGHEPRIDDAMAAGRSGRETLERAAEFAPGLVVVNTATPTLVGDLAFIGDLSVRVPSARFVVFGITAGYFAEDIARRPSVSAVVCGEPEMTVLELASSPDWGVVRGIVTKDAGNRIVRTPPGDPLDPDRLPPPAWDMVDLSPYLLPVTRERYVMVATGRGCPYECVFCVSPGYYGRKLRTKSVENVIRELRFAKSLGISSVFFFVETFTLDRRYVKELCGRIEAENLKITWFCNSRVDTVDLETLRAMRKAGCRIISFGIESGSQILLDRAKKGTTIIQAREAVALAKSAGLSPLGHFLLGLPGETEETVRETVSFARSLPLDFAEFNIVTPYPGSPLFESSAPAAFDDIDWNRYEYSRQVIGSGVDLEAARSRAYRSFYLRPKIVRNMVKTYGWKRLSALVRTGVNFLRGRF
jgi:anaerobic magnesium-protoporphyrin IX monomethyl ester cyclase